MTNVGFMGQEKLLVACYCRVSTKKEEQELSLENQQAFFEAYTKTHAMQIYHIYKDDGISAKSMKRREDFNRMVRDGKKGLFQKILVKDVSRFARNTYDFLGVIRELKLAGIEVLFVTANMSTLNSDLTLTILAAVAQEESQNLSKRVKFAKKISAENGRVPGMVYGYDKIPDDPYGLKINQGEAAVVRRAFHLYGNEQMSTGKIAKLFNEEKVPTKRGGGYQWSPTVISGILKNQLYIGIVCNKKSEVVNFMEDIRLHYEESEWCKVSRPEFQIVTVELFQRANEILESRRGMFYPEASAGTAKRKRPSVKHPLSNLLLCGCDQYSFRRRVRTYAPSGRCYVYWTCAKREYGAGKCGNCVKIDEGQMHQAILDFLCSLFESKEQLLKVFRERFQKRLKQIRKNPSAISSLFNEQKKLEAHKEKLMELYLEEEIDKQALKEKIASLNNRLEELQREMELHKEENRAEIDINGFLDSFFNSIEETPERILDNAFLKSIFTKFEITADGTVTASLQGDNGEMITLPFCLVGQ